MSTYRPLKPALTVAAVALGSLLSGSQAQAQGLFEFLFGERPQPAYQQNYQPAPQYDGYGPMQMRVRPRREWSEEQGTRWPHRGEKAKVARAPKPAKLATPIDPKTNPNWHLMDPTLRRGDVVVLKGQVLVFDGHGTPATKDDFTALNRSRHLSNTERQQIERIAADVPGGGGPPVSRQADVAAATRAQASDPAAKPALVAALTE